jgi:hypothetical protein
MRFPFACLFFLFFLFFYEETLAQLPSCSCLTDGYASIGITDLHYYDNVDDLHAAAPNTDYCWSGVSSDFPECGELYFCSDLASSRWLLCSDGCTDSDGDGTPDSCDICPDDPDESQQRICNFQVTSTCDGVGTYSAGDICGTSSPDCDGNLSFTPAGDQYVSNGDQGWACCELTGCYSKPCEVDPDTCEPKECACPDGGTSCAECQDPDCECPDGSEHCEECQLPGGNGGDGGDGGTDPHVEPPVPDPQELLPDEVELGPCTVSLLEIKQYLLSDDSFPFNYVYAIYGVLNPLFSVSTPEGFQFSFVLFPETPILGSYTLEFNSADYPTFNLIGKIIRFSFAVLILFPLFSFFLKRYRNLFGVGG